ncbi:radical SAM protein [Paenibacillus sp. FSL R10-2734]|uniref:radical SAM/SPASM domain-containing protein n=1 Tax=Paenibacillus sp. FSL R10-2734 TaxID=2954691 RepID=UPI0030DAA03D
MTYFKLKPEVYLVLGKTKSTLHNLVEEKLLWIDNRLGNSIRKAESGESLSDQEFKMLNVFFKKYEWGMFTDYPVFIDKFRSINVYNEKKMHKNTPFIETATLQLTNECNLNCSFCGEMFCPSCRVIEGQAPALSLDEWKLAVDKLEGYGVKTILLTGGEAVTSPYFQDIKEYINGKNISLSIHTNGIGHIEGLAEDNHIIISLFNPKELANIVKMYKKNKMVSIILYDLQNKEKPKVIPESWQVIFSKTKSIPVTNKSMVNVDFDAFFSRKLGNNCLDKKILVAYDGSIYPCMELKNKLGNLRDNEFHMALQKLMAHYWKKGVDQNQNKCKECEFRYACNACSYFNTESCQYDLEEGKWISSFTN